MKTKLLFLIIFFVGITQKSVSQSYAPYLNNSTWNLTVYNFMGATSYNVDPGIDVVIGGNTYKKFVDPVFGGDIFLREDVAARKVYTRKNNVDEVLYDFSLPVGGTFYTPFGSAYTVMSITTSNVSGGVRRVFILDNGFFGFTWIEGVGSPKHPFRPDYELPSDPAVVVSCAAQNGALVYKRSEVFGGMPTDCSMLGIVNHDLINSISFSPNPFKSELQISSEIGFHNVSLKMFNSLGQMVKQVDNINGLSYIFHRDGLSNGLYFMQLSQENKIVAYKKIIVAD